jgi:histidinol-phosphatase (PHP family)
MFRAAGGEVVTLGSDAHRIGNIGAEIFTAMDKLKTAGFSRFAYFVKRNPVMIDIE